MLPVNAFTTHPALKHRWTARRRHLLGALSVSEPCMARASELCLEHVQVFDECFLLNCSHRGSVCSSLPLLCEVHSVPIRTWFAGLPPSFYLNFDFLLDWFCHSLANVEIFPPCALGYLGSPRPSSLRRFGSRGQPLKYVLSLIVLSHCLRRGLLSPFCR